MGKSGMSIIKGDKEKIITLLNQAYADEWLAYYQYFIGSKVIRGIMKDSAIAELVQHAADELRHATMVADRIIQLGGTPILSPKEWYDHSKCGYDAPTNTDVMAILEQNIKGERCAIGVYSSLVDYTKDTDIVTYNIVTQILTDEVEHEEDLQSLYEDIEDMISRYKGN